jgi:hypothetical protein
MLYLHGGFIQRIMLKSQVFSHKNGKKQGIKHAFYFALQPFLFQSMRRQAV